MSINMTYWSLNEDTQLGVKKIVPGGSSVNHQFLLLHDALGSVAQWKSFPEQLSASLQAEVILYDRQGHGHSSPFQNPRNKDFFHFEALEVLPAFIEAHQLQDAIILGHSDGATIALLYASRYTPKAIIAIAPHIFVETITLDGIRQAIKAKEQLLPRLQKYHGNKTEALFDAWALTWTDPGFQDWNIQNELSGISCPLLVLQGDQDEYGSIQQLEGVRKAAPHAQLKLLPGLGHLPHLGSPTEVIQTIRTFVR